MHARYDMIRLYHYLLLVLVRGTYIPLISSVWIYVLDKSWIPCGTIGKHQGNAF
ncbi:hypothetical protein IQ06DRAFT_99638 [Phaeosphaeriaceae sp. SRC1lsM3a]|nr:hypothetical protein IQ06DRAFT_99638 [Stagonospora sp. SRC1lsM3a]